MASTTPTNKPVETASSISTRKRKNSIDLSSSKPAKMAANGTNGTNGTKPKKQILLNAFDSASVGHNAPGQWKNASDRGADKRKLSYWTDLAKLLERGQFNALFLADTTGAHSTYENSPDECIRRGVQFPIMDPTIPITAMASVTKHLCFGVTASTSFETPFLLAKRFSTLDHLTNGRVGWNIVTSWKKSAFKAIGMEEPTGHDVRYEMADEYLNLMYKLWEGSWSDDAIVKDAEKDIYADPAKVRLIKHQGQYYNLESHFLVDPSPQRTPFLYQAGASAAGGIFGAKHSEGIFMVGHSTSLIRPKIDKTRALAAQAGRDPSALKFFVTMTPILGATVEEAEAKYAALKKTASTIGGLVLFSGWTGIDISKIGLDDEITQSDSTEANRVASLVEGLKVTSKEIPKWTPRVLADKASIGSLGPVPVGTAEMVADEMERWMAEADVDGFNIGFATTPGSFEDIVTYLVPELQKRGVYPSSAALDQEPLTAREKVYGKGQSRLRDDHPGTKYKYDVYVEEEPFVKA